MAIERGLSYAMNNLANFYRNVNTYHNATALSVFLKDRNIFDVQKLCVKYYLMAIENDNVDAINHLANYYQSTGDYENAEKYFLMAVEKGDIVAMNNLGYFYQNIRFNRYLAKKYYLMAAEHDNCSSMYNLGHYYQYIEKDYELMKKYYDMAIAKANIDAMHCLGYYHQHTKVDYSLMKKYYLMAAKLNDKMSFCELLYFYKIDKNIQIDQHFIEFCKIANSNIFNVSIPMIFKIIYESYTDKLNSMNLHFSYTPIGNNNNGFGEAKNNFIKKIKLTS